MIQLIADSGSTKTDWRLVRENGIHPFSTEGLNPYHRSREDIVDSLKKNVLPETHGAPVERIYFYGAGCAAPDKKLLVKEALASCFHGAEIFVDSDLYGAVRALLGDKEGFAGIIGTGSNSCRYNGNAIVETIPPLGYILGDEGSGTHIGRHIIKECLRNNFDPELEKRLLDFCGLDREEIMDRIYRNPDARQFLAGLVKFAFQNIGNAQILRIINYCFAQYFSNMVKPYKLNAGYHLNFTGSIAFYFRQQLTTVLEEQGYIVDRILQSPVDGLVQYHLRHLK
jgi:glucosamine kinase